MGAIEVRMILVVAGLYGLLVAYCAVGGWRRSGRDQRIGLIWFLATPLILFASLGHCGDFLWMFVFLDAMLTDDRGPEYVRKAALITALVVAAAVALRLSLGWASKRFCVVAIWGSAGLLACYGGVYGFDFVRQIDGWTALGAAERGFARLPYKGNPYVDPSATPRIVEEDLSLENPGWAKGGWFVQYVGPARIQYVHVARHGPWWWTSSGSGGLVPDPRVFERAREKWATDPAEATRVLEAIARDYPNSEGARRAEATLQELLQGDTAQRAQRDAGL